MKIYEWVLERDCVIIPLRSIDDRLKLQVGDYYASVLVEEHNESLKSMAETIKKELSDERK